MSRADPGVVLADSPWAGRPGLAWKPGVAAVASPMCQAVEWSSWVVTSDGSPEALFLKILEPELAGFVDVEAAQAGAVAGQRAGAAPPVVFALPQHRAVAYAYLPPPWRGARLDDLTRPEVLQAAIAAKRAVRQGLGLPRRWDVFDRVRFYARTAQADGTAMPGDMPELLARVAEIGSALAAAGCDEAPCHNDGNASNLLLAPDGKVLLADFDCAGQADPCYDLAVLLNEASSAGVDWRIGVEIDQGRCDQRVLNRCRAYAVADDLLWGLWGLILSAISPRRDVEFLKYGEWRLLRCRMALREPGFADRLHRL